MITKNDRPSFKICHIEPFWNSRIRNLESLKYYMSDAILVAFDMEGWRGNITELGLAILSTDENKPRYCPGRCRFYDENKVQAFTIEIHRKPQTYYEFKRHGDTVRVESEEEAVPLLERILAQLQGSGRLILVGYAMYTEFQWIADRCPSLVSHFSAWMDVQELAANQCNVLQPGLTNVLRALGITDNRHNAQNHSAANDAVRELAVLAGLLSGVELTIEQPPRNEIKKFTSLPRPKSYGPRTQYPYSARITAADGDLLPDRTLKNLMKMYAMYDLKAVGMNSSSKKPVRIWWIAFHTLESLQGFILHFDESDLDGRLLKVVRATGKQNDVL